eukprot:1320624-Rhodomonas_salina.1
MRRKKGKEKERTRTGLNLNGYALSGTDVVHVAIGLRPRYAGLRARVSPPKFRFRVSWSMVQGFRFRNQRKKDLAGAARVGEDEDGGDEALVHHAQNLQHTHASVRFEKKSR